MTEGTYTSLDITGILAGMPEVAQVLRPVLNEDASSDAPWLAATGALEVSSDHTLVLYRDHPVWDVNGYYRALGIAPPFKPTRRELRIAYQAIGGPENEHATYAFKRLLDRDFRFLYDHRELGEPVDDKYRWEMALRAAARWASRETALTGKLVEASEFIPENIREKMLAKPDPHADFAVTNHAGWEFGYYLWNTRHRDDRALATWQELLIKSFWKRGLSRRFAVGYVDRASQPAAVRYRLSHPDVEAIFLQVGQSMSPALADAVTASCEALPALQIQEQIEIQFPDYDTQITHTRPADAGHISQGNDMTDSTELDLDFSTGVEEAEQLLKDEREARKAARGGANWFSLKDDGDTEILRFLIPHTKWIYVKQHDFIPTKGAPSDLPEGREWNKSSGAVCRYTLIGPPDNRRKAFEECYICDHVKVKQRNKMMPALPSLKVWTTAASRLSLVGTEELVEQGRIHESQIGKKVIIDDQELVDEIDPKTGNPTGKKVWRKKIYIVNQSVRNFFSSLTTIAKLQGTITDRDYAIVRKGEARADKVSYEPVDLGAFDVVVPKIEGEGTEQIRFDPQDPRIAERYQGHGIDEASLRKIINRRISKDWYNFYFDQRVAVGWKDFFGDNDDEDSGNSSASSADKPAPTQEQQDGNVAGAEPTEGVTADRMAKMREKVMASGSGGADTPPPSAEAAPLS